MSMLQYLLSIEDGDNQLHFLFLAALGTLDHPPPYPLPLLYLWVAEGFSCMLDLFLIYRGIYLDGFKGWVSGPSGTRVQQPTKCLQAACLPKGENFSWVVFLGSRPVYRMMQEQVKGGGAPPQQY